MAKKSNETTAQPDTQSDGVVVRYTGEGSYITGVPARDLTLEEWEAFPAPLRSAMVAQGLYALPPGVEIPTDVVSAETVSAAPTAG